MDWSRLAGWLYENGTPDIEKLRRYKIGVVYVDPRSLNAEQVIRDLRAAGVNAGLYEVPQWYPGITASAFATKVSTDIQRLIPQAYPLPTQTQGAPVMLDFEQLPRQWIADFAASYHRLRPARETCFTTEPYKYGQDIPIPELAALGWPWFVQLYTADMSPVDDPAWALLAIARGYPPQLVHGFYDGARPPARATDGAIFTVERLP